VACLDHSAAKGINGKQDDDSASEAGAVYLFTRRGTTWAQQAYVKADTNEAFDEFGGSVAVSADGKVFAASAHGEDSNARAPYGDQKNNRSSESGAVYLFSVN